MCCTHDRKPYVSVLTDRRGVKENVWFRIDFQAIAYYK